MSKIRFAPSPTGLLHVGNARIAVINGLYALKVGADFLLRLDDTDPERSSREYAESIQKDLTWLGLEWSQMIRQSERLDLYQDAFETLRARGRVYACYETPEELALMRKRLLAQGKPPIYDRSGLDLNKADGKRLEAQGRQAHWRFRLDDTPISWEDRVHGAIHFNKLSVSDPVLYRSDGRPLFTLPSVVDDMDLSISLVIRGDDHIANTAVQISLFQALGAPPPDFAHLPLLTDAKGGDLSKRHQGVLSLQSLAEKGIEPMALNTYLTGLGYARPVALAESLEVLSADFDFGDFSKASARFNDRELWRLNRRLLQGMAFSQAEPRLAQMGLSGIEESFWLSIRGNLECLDEAKLWWQVCCGQVKPEIRDESYLALALERLPPSPWSEKTWGEWTSALKKETGRQGKSLFLPLRLALTGVEQGPGLDRLLPLMGRSRALSRLSGQTG